MTEAPDWWAITARVANRRGRPLAEARRSPESRASAPQPTPAVPAVVGAVIDRLTEQVKRLTPATVTEVAPAAQTTVTESEPEQPPVKQLHEMSSDEFRAHCAGVYSQVGESMDSPLWRTPEQVSITDFLARGHYGRP